MTTESMCVATALQERMAPDITASERAPQQSIMHRKVRWPLCFICSYSPLVKVLQICKKLFCLNLVTMESAGAKSEGNHDATPIINHAPKSELAIYTSFMVLLCLLYSITDE